MAVTETQYRAQRKYDNTHTKQFQMKLHLVNDVDILEWLDKQDSKQGSVKKRIRKRLRRKESKRKCEPPHFQV